MTFIVSDGETSMDSTILLLLLQLNLHFRFPIQQSSVESLDNDEPKNSIPSNDVCNVYSNIKSSGDYFPPNCNTIIDCQLQTAVDDPSRIIHNNAFECP